MNIDVNKIMERLAQEGLFSGENEKNAKPAQHLLNSIQDAEFKLLVSCEPVALDEELHYNIVKALIQKDALLSEVQKMISACIRHDIYVMDVDEILKENNTENHPSEKSANLSEEAERIVEAAARKRGRYR